MALSGFGQNLRLQQPPAFIDHTSALMARAVPLVSHFETNLSNHGPPKNLEFGTNYKFRDNQFIVIHCNQ